jgi:hypothetical protein
MNKTEQIFFVSLDGTYESTTAVSAKTAIKAANTIHKRDGATNLVLRCGSVELKYRTTRGNKNLRGILGLMQAHNELGRNFEALQGELNTLAGWNDEQGERVDFMGLGFLAGMPSIAEKLGDDPPVTNMQHTANPTVMVRRRLDGRSRRPVRSRAMGGGGNGWGVQ